MALRLRHRHEWAVAPAEARAIQERLRGKVETRDRLPRTIRRVAGVDIGFTRRGGDTRAAVAVLSAPDLALVERAVVTAPTRFPYVPGLLSFREIPAALEALAHLAVLPDLILCDGQGYAHPRRFGLACHLGVITGIATIGVAKTRLVGEHGDVPEGRGEWTALEHEGETIGAVLRTRAGVKPVYVSVGNRCSLATAIEWTMRCTTRYRLPETTRAAHRLASG